MFDIIWGYLKGVREGQQRDYPMSERPDYKEVRVIAKAIKVNDYVICPNRREAARVAKLLRDWGSDYITRSVMHDGKEAIKVWRIR